MKTILLLLLALSINACGVPVSLDSAQKTGDVVLISGTVNGELVTIQVWWSYISKLGSKAAIRNFVASELKSAYDRAHAVSAVDISGPVIDL